MFCFKSTESLVLEVLEELEEFTEREKNFENKYVKTITELKSEAFKTEEELSKVSSDYLWENSFKLLKYLDQKQNAWV